MGVKNNNFNSLTVKLGEHIIFHHFFGYLQYYHLKAWRTNNTYREVNIAGSSRVLKRKKQWRQST